MAPTSGWLTGPTTWSASCDPVNLDWDKSRRVRWAFPSWAGAVLLAGLLASGCTTRLPDGSTRRHYFGYAVVTVPAPSSANERMLVREVRNCGLGVGAGSAVLGFGAERHIALPLDGRMLVVVQTDEQLQRTLQFIKENPELGLCVTKQKNP